MFGEGYSSTSNCRSASGLRSASEDPLLGDPDSSYMMTLNSSSQEVQESLDDVFSFLSDQNEQTGGYNDVDYLWKDFFDSAGPDGASAFMEFDGYSQAKITNDADGDFHMFEPTSSPSPSSFIEPKHERLELRVAPPMAAQATQAIKTEVKKHEDDDAYLFQSSQETMCSSLPSPPATPEPAPAELPAIAVARGLFHPLAAPGLLTPEPEAIGSSTIAHHRSQTPQSPTPPRPTISPLFIPHIIPRDRILEIIERRLRELQKRSNRQQKLTRQPQFGDNSLRLSAEASRQDYLIQNPGRNSYRHRARPSIPKKRQDVVPLSDPFDLCFKPNHNEPCIRLDVHIDDNIGRATWFELETGGVRGSIANQKRFYCLLGDCVYSPYPVAFDARDLGQHTQNEHGVCAEYFWCPKEGCSRGGSRPTNLLQHMKNSCCPELVDAERMRLVEMGRMRLPKSKPSGRGVSKPLKPAKAKAAPRRPRSTKKKLRRHMVELNEFKSVLEDEEAERDAAGESDPDYID